MGDRIRPAASRFCNNFFGLLGFSSISQTREMFFSLSQLVLEIEKRVFVYLKKTKKSTRNSEMREDFDLTPTGGKVLAGSYILC